jgi:hypothetical protein
MAKAIWKAAVVGVTLPSGLAHAGERVGFISVPSFHFAPAKAFCAIHQ